MSQNSDMGDSVVSRIALIIRRCYCMYTRWVRQLESYNPPDHKYGKYWTNAAVVCVTNRINPAEYIEVLFAATKPRWPEIRQIASTWALELYYKHAEAHASVYISHFNVQIHAFECLVRQGIDPERVLLREDQEFDPLFVYVAAEANGLDKLARDTEEAALAKYLTSVHYDQLYRDAIPEKFKKFALEKREGANAKRLD